MPKALSIIKEEKIIVVGSPGAGKTTCAKRLAKQTGLPLFHLDEMFWAPQWVEKGRECFRESLLATLDEEKWIIDGNYMSTMQERLAVAEAVIFIDVPFWICTYRIIKRWLRREGMQAEGCPQRIDMAFIKYVAWTFPRRDRRRRLALLRDYEGRGTLYIL